MSRFFWEAHRLVPPNSVSTPLRAFVYLTSGRYAADQHFKIFDQWQEKNVSCIGCRQAILKRLRLKRKSRLLL